MTAGGWQDRKRPRRRGADAGTVVAMMADVPLGELRTAGAGNVTLARHSGRPIIPIAAATARAYELTGTDWARTAPTGMRRKAPRRYQ